jgi:hypothetical protein
MHDNLKKLPVPAFFSGYSFVLPFFTVLLIVLLRYIHKAHGGFLRITQYLNLLFCSLLLFDAGAFLLKNYKNSYYGSKALPAIFTRCDTCAMPDVYLIVADEYAGHDELKDVFGYDNSPFENNLKSRGFHLVPHSKSNYNFTPFSMASALNVSYLPIKDTNHTTIDIPLVMGLIADNDLTQFFYKQGYTVFNNSIFDLPGKPKQALSSFLPNQTKYITGQTLLSRLERDLYYHLITDLKWKWAIQKGLMNNLESNTYLYKKTIETSRIQVKSKFSYTHLSMPHWPYYFDEFGKQKPLQELQNDKSNESYISYLKYSNKKILSLVDSILKNNATPPTIFLISDHGFRLSNKPNERNYNFSNICAVYTTNKNYKHYPDDLSLVNLFRVFLNTQFGQQLPLLQDQTFFLKD